MCKDAVRKGRGLFYVHVVYNSLASRLETVKWHEFLDSGEDQWDHETVNFLYSIISSNTFWEGGLQKFYTVEPCFNGHPWIVDIHDNSESPDCPSIDFNTEATPE